MPHRRRVTWAPRVTQVLLLTLLAVAFVLGSGNPTLAKRPTTLIYLDGHMHTTKSDGSGTVADIKATALSRGLDAVIVTDHCKYLTRTSWAELVAETAAASTGSFLALPGFEITGDDGLQRDHIVAYGVDDPFVGDDADELCPEEVWPSPYNWDGTGPLYPERLTKWVDYVHSQQGIALHAHTLGSTRLDQSAFGVNHLEIYNPGTVDRFAYYAQALGYTPQKAWELGMALNNTGLYGERDLNTMWPFPPSPVPIPLRLGVYYATLYMVPPYAGQWLGSPEAPLNSWDELLLAYVDGTLDAPVFALANSDAHDTAELDSRVGKAKNGLYVKEFTAREIYKAIKAGRSFATTGPSLAFQVNGEFMGDTARITGGSARLDLSVDSENPAAILVKIDVIKNGQVWRTVEPNSASYQAILEDDSVTEDGYYRVEVTSCELANGVCWPYYFAWSNPVFVRVN